MKNKLISLLFPFLNGLYLTDIWKLMLVKAKDEVCDVLKIVFTNVEFHKRFIMCLKTNTNRKDLLQFSIFELKLRNFDRKFHKIFEISRKNERPKSWLNVDLSQKITFTKIILSYKYGILDIIGISGWLQDLYMSI